MTFVQRLLPLNTPPDQREALTTFCVPEHVRRWGCYFESSSCQIQSDGEFIAAKQVQFSLRAWRFSCENYVIPVPLSKVLDQAKVKLEDALLALRHCETVLGVTIDSALKLTPRALRLCSVLDLSDKERDAVLYVAAMQASTHVQCASSNQNLNPACVAQYAGMSPQEIMSFLNDSRVHVRQGLIQLTEVRNKGVVNDARLWMPPEAVSALCGNQLSEEQFIKLDKTFLAQVLQEERCPFVCDEKKEEAPSSCSDSDASSSDEEKAEVQSARDEQTTTVESNGRKRKRTDESGHSPTISHHPETPQTKMHKPYTSDIEYIDDACRALATTIKVRNAESEMKDEDDICFNPKNKVESSLRELKGRERVARATITSRLQSTITEGKWLPRLESLATQLSLSLLEKNILLFLVGNVVSHDVLIAINGRFVLREGQRELTVGYVLFVLCESLLERVEGRKCFYRKSALIERGVISASLPTQTRTCFNTDLTDYMVDIDRKMVDYIIGLDTESKELVQGSNLYNPAVPMSNVVLCDDTMQIVTSTIRHYEMFSAFKKSSRFGEGLGDGALSGLVLLFFGPSGTGKTMLANAIASDLGKKILLVSLVQYKGDPRAAEIIRFVFREAKLNNAIVFFDECESVFESRDSNPFVTAVLNEFERYDGMIILATNKAQILDDAMNRRISVAVEFRLPDHNMRRQIWQKHLPPNIKLDGDVNLEAVALDFELSGGLIKNAMLAAMESAVARENSASPTLQMRDFVKGAKAQLRGFFQAEKALTEAYITPHHSLSDIVVEESTYRMLEEISRVAKSRSALFSHWGFEESDLADQGAVYLFYGPSGSGKSLAAEAIAYECGCNLRIANVCEMLLQHEISIHTIFEEAKKLQAVICFDASQQLFDYSEKSNHITQLIRYHAVTYPRPVIMIVPTDVSSLDIRATRLNFSSCVQFKLPNRNLRIQLWRKFLPPKVPLSKDVNFEILGDTFCVSAKTIRQVCFAACSKAVLLPAEKRFITMKSLSDEANLALLNERQHDIHSSMFL